MRPERLLRRHDSSLWRPAEHATIVTMTTSRGSVGALQVREVAVENRSLSMFEPLVGVERYEKLRRAAHEANEELRSGTGGSGT
jgi:hypothetical protein